MKVVWCWSLTLVVCVVDWWLATTASEADSLESRTRLANPALVQALTVADGGASDVTVIVVRQGGPSPGPRSFRRALRRAFRGQSHRQRRLWHHQHLGAGFRPPLLLQNSPELVGNESPPGGLSFSPPLYLPQSEEPVYNDGQFGSAVGFPPGPQQSLPFRPVPDQANPGVGSQQVSNGYQQDNAGAMQPQPQSQWQFQRPPGQVFSYHDTKRDRVEQQDPELNRPVLRFQTSCGVSTTSRIVGGESVHRDDYSWTVALLRPSRRGMEQFCGATLITDEHLVTAAHCVVSARPSDLMARVGRADIARADPSADYPIRSITRHPHFNMSTYFADLALLTLARPVELNTRLRPCCLPEPVDHAGHMGVVVGWGSTSFGGPQANVLQHVSLPIWSNSECREKVSIEVHDEMICAGRKDKGGHDACQGDSGGPLLVRDEQGRWSLEGIVSFGFKCAQKGVPGIYTRVSSFSDWIVNNAL